MLRGLRPLQNSLKIIFSWYENLWGFSHFSDINPTDYKNSSVEINTGEHRGMTQEGGGELEITGWIDMQKKKKSMVGSPTETI